MTLLGNRRPTLNIAKLSITFLLATTTALSSSAQTPAGSAPAASVGGGSRFAKPPTQAQLPALLQAAMNGLSVIFRPDWSGTVSCTMTVLVPDNRGNICGNGLKSRSTINNGSEVLQLAA